MKTNTESVFPAHAGELLGFDGGLKTVRAKVGEKDDGKKKQAVKKVAKKAVKKAVEEEEPTEE